MAKVGKAMKRKSRGYQRLGGRRKDRVFKVYLVMPPDASEDEVMDYIEDAVSNYREYEPPRRAHGFDANTVCVKRRTPKYAEHK